MILASLFIGGFLAYADPLAAHFNIPPSGKHDLGQNKYGISETASLAEAGELLMQSLTPREKEVLDYIVNGKATKVVALELGLSKRTVDIYRANIMQKMQSRSIAQLVKMISKFDSYPLS